MNYRSKGSVSLTEFKAYLKQSSHNVYEVPQLPEGAWLFTSIHEAKYIYLTTIFPFVITFDFKIIEIYIIKAINFVDYYFFFFFIKSCLAKRRQHKYCMESTVSLNISLCMCDLMGNHFGWLLIGTRKDFKP